MDITPQQDGGVLKEIIRPGSGDDTPLTGDKVFVHYVGTLPDGTVFDSSREKQQEFEFKLDKGMVIKAWDIGVATMKRGEIASITCQPSYAYGNTGSGLIVGPNTSLQFEIELLRWEEEDLSPHKDGSIIRRMFIKGDGHDMPNDGATVHVKVIGKLADRVFDDREVHFVLGEGGSSKIPSGLEHALKKFKKGEKSRLHIKSHYAFGKISSTALDIPENTDVTYDVEMMAFEKVKELWEMNNDEKIEHAKISKEKGGNFFKEQNYLRAVQCYKRVVYLLEGETSSGDRIEREELLLPAYLNLALCHLKLENYHEAEKQSDNALNIDPVNEKALYRRGQARLNKKLYELSIDDFNAVLSVAPNNQAAKKLLNLATQKLTEFRKKEKNVYAGMFNKLAAKESVPAAEVHKNNGDDVFQAIDEWQNDMAKDMMSLEQELEAFGEKMPVKSTRKPGESTSAAD